MGEKDDIRGQALLVYPWSQTEKKLCKKMSKETNSVEKSVSVPIGEWRERCEEGKIHSDTAWRREEERQVRCMALGLVYAFPATEPEFSSVS